MRSVKMCSLGMSKVCWMRRSAMPGMRRIWSMMWSANSRLASTFFADDLHVDGRGQSEIQNLADDIVGQKVEIRARKFPRQSGAQHCAQIPRWAGAPRSARP